jgi:HAD superfamily hydrolase (TIGR01509 family)
MQTLIFDCDGVLVDSEALAEETLAERLGSWLPDLDLERLLSQALGMTTADILDHLERLSRHSLPTDAAEHIDSAIEARLGAELCAIAGAAEAIRAIALPKAVVSNSRRSRVVASLATTGLDTVLGQAPIFTAEQVERPKPDPAIYRLAAHELGLTPRECLVVEDSVAGVSAAHAAGMIVIGFTGASHLDAGQGARLLQAGAWQVIDRFSELEGWVNDWQRAADSIQP